MISKKNLIFSQRAPKTIISKKMILSRQTQKQWNAEYYLVKEATVLLKPVDLMYLYTSRDYDFFLLK